MARTKQVVRGGHPRDDERLTQQSTAGVGGADPRNSAATGTSSSAANSSGGRTANDNNQNRANDDDGPIEMRLTGTVGRRSGEGDDAVDCVVLNVIPGVTETNGNNSDDDGGADDDDDDDDIPIGKFARRRRRIDTTTTSSGTSSSSSVSSSASLPKECAGSVRDRSSTRMTRSSSKVDGTNSSTAGTGSTVAPVHHDGTSSGNGTLNPPPRPTKKKPTSSIFSGLTFKPGSLIGSTTG